MKAIERETVENKDQEGATDITDRTDRRRPRLTDEQREWLNTVFIPNFRAELMRTLRPEDLVGGNGRRGRGGRKGKGADGQGTSGGASPTRLAADGSPGRGDVEEPASDEAAGQALNEEAAQEMQQTDGNDPAREGKTAAERRLGRSRQAGEQAAEEAPERVVELEGEVRRLRAIVAETRVDGELVSAAAAQHAISPAQVAHLLKDRIRLDRNLDPMVVDANGDRAYDGYGRPVTPADAVRAFLEANPHHVRPSTQLAGGGSGGTDATVTARRIAAMTGGDLIEEALREGL